MNNETNATVDTTETLNTIAVDNDSTETVMTNENDINENEQALGQDLEADKRGLVAAFAEELGDELSDSEREAAAGEIEEQVEGMDTADVALAKEEAKSAKPKAESKQKTPAAHIAFIEAVRVHAQALGLNYKDQAGFAQFNEAETGHKLYVAKQGKQVNRVDTTLPLIGVIGAAFELEVPNGRIACHLPAEQAVIFQALDMMAEKKFGKLRAPNRPAKAQTASK